MIMDPKVLFVHRHKNSSLVNPKDVHPEGPRRPPTSQQRIRRTKKSLGSTKNPKGTPDRILL